ncbi:MAG: D-alanyl-D-alanine carboxypeptidase family protein [Clostridiaceae bacterium]|nr:D-alanyl-D-alanine carboxypeptidase family protein [Clostridiaceae bacterium]
MKKTLSFILVCVLLFLTFQLGAYAADYPEMQVEVHCKSAVLMEASTGRVLMAKDADMQVYPASVTKIMSLLLVTEAIDRGQIALTDIVTASAYASKKGGSQIWLKEGEQMTVDDMLKATAVASANDACTALGEFIAGSEDAFVNKMNERAKELGMNNTHFENCTGLDDTADGHLTTAYDIALMSRELLKHERIRNYSTIWTDTLRGGETALTNTNKLIRFYDGATGLKTGTTSKAGCCVSATAERDGLELIAVVMGSDNSNDRFNSARAMLDWGFANYSSVELAVDQTLIVPISVINGREDIITPDLPETQRAVVAKGRQADIVQVVELPVDVEAPVENGQTLGTVSFKLDGEDLAVYTLKAPHSVEKLSFFERWKRLVTSII